MSTPPKQPTPSSDSSKASKRRREHPLFHDSDAVKSARRRAQTSPPPSQPIPPRADSDLPTKATYAASRPDTVTANGAPTFSSSGSATLDLFFNGLVRGCPADTLQRLLAASWHASPRTTLQLIAHSRDCRNGKGERLVSLHSLLFLRSHKPLSYLANLLTYLGCGYFKDLLVLAARVEEAGGDRLGEAELIELEVMAEFLRFDAAQLDRADNKAARQSGKAGDEQGQGGKGDENDAKDEKDEKDEKEDDDEDDGDGYVLVEGVEKLSTSDSGEMKDDTADKDDKKDDAADEKRSDQLAKRRTPRMTISLAGKWAPSEDSHFDKAPYRFAHRLARLLFPASPRPMPQYRKLLGRLRAHLQVVEKLMCADQWEAIQFERVPSKAHALLKKAFLRHQSERYAEYLQAVKRGEKTVKVTGLQPHELTSGYRHGEPHNETTELQWQALVERTKAAGKLTGAVAVVDVSGSMDSGSGSVRPMDPAIALGLLISNVAVGPFANRVLTFHTDPNWFVLPPGSSLHDQVNAVKAAPWGGSTDLQMTFDLILSLAVEHSIPASQMPSTLFILSDMQFNAACGPFNVTNHEVIQTKYRLAGYAMPSVVFWNLNGGRGNDAPVKADKAGVAMLSGYSGELLKLIMDGASLTPEAIMLMAVDSYDVVVEDAER